MNIKGGRKLNLLAEYQYLGPDSGSQISSKVFGGKESKATS